MKLKVKDTLGKILQRLNKIGTPVSGYTSKSVSASTSTTINTIDVPAGTWLLLSYMDLSASSSASSYNHYLFGAGVINRVVRSTPYNGGGSVNWAVITGPASVDVIAHVPVACTVRTSYSLIYLGGVARSILKALQSLAYRKAVVV